MFPYFAVLALFWGGATVSFFKREYNPLVLIVVFLVFVLFAGTRFETGFDWVVYERALEEVPRLSDLFDGAVLQDTVRLMEPLFLLLLSFLKSIDANIQSLFLLVAFFNAAVLVRFFHYTRTDIAVGLAIYFSWVYLIVQMAVVRQSLAVSFLMLAIIAFDKRLLIRTAFYLLLGIFMQYSLALFVPIFFTAVWRRLITARWWILVVLTLLLLTGLSLFGLLNVVAGLIPNEFIATKLKDYASLAPPPGISLSTAAYFIFHTAIFLSLAQRYDDKSKIETVLMSSMLMMLMVQALIPEWPLLWNRIYYFVIVAQIVMLFRRWKKEGKLAMQLEYLVIFLVSLAMFCKLILWPGMEPFLPYQSYFWHEWTGYIGDGRERSEFNYLQFDQKLRTDKLEQIQ